MASKSRQSPIEDLPNAEMEVLALVCDRGSATTREVADGLAPHRQMGLSASQALLLRLEAKGLLQREKIEGRNAYRYTPTNIAEPTYRRLARNIVDRVFAGSPRRLMASLFEARDLSPQEIAELRKLIDQAARQSK